MLEQTKRIRYHSEFLLFYLRWSRSPEPDLHTGSDQKVPVLAPTGSGSATLALNIMNQCFGFGCKGLLYSEYESGSRGLKKF